MDFEADVAWRSYSDRDAASDWHTFARLHFDPMGREAVDLGCGGGIYSRALRELGATRVTGVDGSAQYVSEATAASADDNGLGFVQGDATASGLSSACCDLVLSRALVHHLDGAAVCANAAEMKRLLRAGGVAVVQDRSLEDAVASDDEFWIRRTLFESQPQLVEVERARRPATEGYVEVLHAAGFASVRVETLGETRRVHESFDALRAEVLARKGKSILFELDDDQLAAYADALAEVAPANGPLVERDRWTFWIASVD